MTSNYIDICDQLVCRADFQWLLVKKENYECRIDIQYRGYDKYQVGKQQKSRQIACLYLACQWKRDENK